MRINPSNEIMRWSTSAQPHIVRLAFKPRQSGFTLIELMLVVAIIGVLASIAIPKFADMVTRSKEAAAKGMLGSMRSAMTIYVVDHDGINPTYWRDFIGTNYLPFTIGPGAGVTMVPHMAIPPVSAQGNPGHDNVFVSNNPVLPCIGDQFGNYSQIAAIDSGSSAVYDGVPIDYAPTAPTPTSNYCSPSQAIPGGNYMSIMCPHNDTTGKPWTTW